MQVQQDLKTCGSGPANSLVKIWQLPLDVWISFKRSDGPIPDRYAHMIETGGRYLGKVVFSYPSTPMLFKARGRFGRSKGLSIGIFINDGLTRGPVVEDGGSDPRF
jgi:hypothetical protein